MSPRAEATCLFCGEPERIGLHEIWPDHRFVLEACCADHHDQVVAEMADDPAWGRWLLRRMGAEDLTGHRLRRLADDGGSGMLLDWQLTLRPVSFHVVRAFIARHHAHCGPPVAWRFGHGVANGQMLLGVVAIGNPVARALCGRGIVEVNRLCIRRDVPPALAWNAASMLYGWSARAAERQGWSRIITYIRADEDGTTLKASGWNPESTVKGRGWHNGSRSRSNRNSWIDKTRWGKTLTPRRAKPLPPSAPAALPGAHKDLHAMLFDHPPTARNRL